MRDEENVELMWHDKNVWIAVRLPDIRMGGRATAHDYLADIMQHGRGRQE